MAISKYAGQSHIEEAQKLIDYMLRSYCKRVEREVNGVLRVEGNDVVHREAYEQLRLHLGRAIDSLNPNQDFPL